MSIFEFSIACKNETEEHRKQEGDIISFKEYPSTWGRIVRKNCLIVLISGITYQDAINFCSVNRPDGKNKDEVVDDDLIEPIGKRKYSVPLELIKKGWYPDLDLDRVRNPHEDYQPLKDNNIIIQAEEPVAIFFNKFLGRCKYTEEKIYGV